MPPLADLHRAVQTTLAGKRLGRPVFVRYTLHGPEKAEAVVPRLAQLVVVVRGWLGQPPERVYAVGSPADGQVSLTLQFRDGATALVSFARGQPPGAGADVTVFGNRVPGAAALMGSNRAFLAKFVNATASTSPFPLPATTIAEKTFPKASTKTCTIVLFKTSEWV